MPGASRQVVPRVVLTPSGERVTLDGEGPDVLELAEQGFYEVRGQGRDAAPPRDRREQHRSRGIGSHADGSAGSRRGRAGPRRRRCACRDATVTATDVEQERAQRIWWYLLFAGVVVLGLETLMGNRVVAEGTRFRSDCHDL